MSERICPKLSTQALLRHRDGGLLLRHTKAGTQLFVRGQHVTICKLMNGQTPLELLEKILAQDSQSAYQDLTHLLFLLWDRGLLENDDDIRNEFFPHKTGRTFDQALTERKYKWIYSLQGEIQDVLLYTPILGFFAILAILGIVPFFMMQIDPSAHFFLQPLENSPRMVAVPVSTWLPQLVSLYLSFSAFLTLRGALRGTLILMHKKTPSVLFRITLGIVYFDIDDSVSFQLNKDQQIRFASASLIFIGLLGSFLAYLGLLTNEPMFLTFSVIAYLCLFFDLCPYFSTSGSQLLENFLGLNKQRFRVGTFMQQRLVQGIFDNSKSKEDKSFGWLATIWILWFYGFFRIFNIFVVGHLQELRQLTQSSSTIGQVIAWVILGYSMLLTIALLISIGYLIIRFFYQISTAPPTKASEIKGSTLSEEHQIILGTFLESVDIFSNISEEEKNLLMSGTELRSYKGNSIVYVKHQNPDMLYYILNGTVEICDPLPEGGFKGITTLSKGDYFGEESLINTKRLHSIYSNKGVQVLAINPKVIDNQDGEHTPSKLLEILVQQQAFSGLSTAGLLALICRSQIKNVDPDTAIIKTGDTAESMYVILNGHCNVLVENDIVANLQSGSIFGEMGLMFQQPRSADVYSVEQATLLEIPAEALQESMQRSFQMGLALETLANQRSKQDEAS